MADLKPAYLIHGDDSVQIDAWRKRVRVRVAREGASASLEILKDERLTGEAMVAAISSLTLSVGRRYVLADGIERWKDAEVKLVAKALADMPADTVVVMIKQPKPSAKGKEAEAQPAAVLVKAVEGCGGEVRLHKGPARGGLLKWIGDRARALELALDRDAAQALVERAGFDDKGRLRQQRLLRELEKLSVYAGGERSVSTEDVEAVAVSAAESRIYDLADAVIDGDGEGAIRIAEELRERGLDIMHILYSLLRQLRNCHRAWAMDAAGQSLNDIQSELRLPHFLIKDIVAQARRADPEQVERAIDLVAELDWQIRGGGTLDADSALTLTLARATGALESTAA